MSDTPARPPFRSGAIAEPRLPLPDFPAQEQPFPGLAAAMDPRPDHGESSYRGSGRLAGRKALVTGGDRRQRRTNRLDQGFSSSGFGLTHESLDLGERFLDGVEIRRVRRQVDELAASLFDQLAYPFAFM